MEKEPRERTIGKERKTTTLVSVMEQLKINKDLWCAERPIFSTFTYTDGSLGEEAKIAVAPVNPIFDRSKLGNFMDNLAKKFRVSKKYPINRELDKGMSPGSLSFFERIGIVEKETKSIVTAINPAALRRLRIPIGEKVKKTKENLAREVFIYVFPDVLSAKIAFAYASGEVKGQDLGSVINHIRLDSLPYITRKQIEFLKENQGMDVFEAVKATEALVD